MVLMLCVAADQAENLWTQLTDHQERRAGNGETNVCGGNPSLRR